VIVCSGCALAAAARSDGSQTAYLLPLWSDLAGWSSGGPAARTATWLMASTGS